MAGMNANVWDVVHPIQTLIRDGRPVDTDRLADPDVPLDQMASEPAGHRLGVLAARGQPMTNGSAP